MSSQEMGIKTKQQLLFKHIEESLHSHISMVDEIADLFDMSNDSIYRRIRGDKILTLDEIQKLCIHFNLSLDQILGMDSKVTLFTDLALDEADLDFAAYLQKMIEQLQYMMQYDNPKIYFLAKDIPVFYFFQFPEIASFKYFHWQRSILNDSALQNTKFSLDEIPQNLHSKGKKILEIYNKMDSIELWNVENINGTIRQIEYYKESGIFSDPSEAVTLYDTFIELINHIEEMASSGLKYTPGQSPSDKSPEYQFYYNEVFLGDNTVLVDLGKDKIAFLNHSVLNYIITHDERFCNYLHGSIENLIKRSTLISSVGERDRIRFFNSLRNKIEQRRKAAFREMK